LIGRLTGRVVEESEGGALVVDVNGVGYELTAPIGSQGRLSADPSGAVTFHIHTHVREDALQLFGFASAEERDAFRTIIGIANVGPKLAISILGAMATHDLAQVVARGEVAKLTLIPGVGKKTAERLVLELKGKLSARPSAHPDRPHVPVAVEGSRAEMVLGALTRMGFRPAEADRAVTALAQGRNLDDAPIGDLVREALAILSR
jgi:Holliday junction DNA helicase RuvA